MAFLQLFTVKIMIIFYSVRTQTAVSTPRQCYIELSSAFLCMDEQIQTKLHQNVHFGEYFSKHSCLGICLNINS